MKAAETCDRKTALVKDAAILRRTKENITFYWSELLSRKGIYEWKEPKHQCSPSATTASAIKLQDWVMSSGWGRRLMAAAAMGWKPQRKNLWPAAARCLRLHLCLHKNTWGDRWSERTVAEKMRVITGKAWKRQKIRAWMRYIKTKNNRKWKEK